MLGTACLDRQTRRIAGIVARHQPHDVQRHQTRHQHFPKQRQNRHEPTILTKGVDLQPATLPEMPPPDLAPVVRAENVPDPARQIVPRITQIIRVAETAINTVPGIHTRTALHINV